MHIVLGPVPASSDSAGPSGSPVDPWLAVLVRGGRAEELEPVSAAALPDLVRTLPGRFGADPGAVRWVFAAAGPGYRSLLEAGVRLSRCWDLGLCQRILVTAGVHTPAVQVPVPDPEPWSPPGGDVPTDRRGPADQGTFFDLPDSGPGRGARPHPLDLARELLAQLESVERSPAPHRMRLLLAAESQGALIAAEILHEGLPWRRDLHEAMLERALGPRPAEGQRPRRLQELAERIGVSLGVPGLNPDSQQDLLRGLHLAGVRVDSTRAWELKAWAADGGADSARRTELIAGVLEYKHLYRLWTANGWHWLDEWVHGGRFHPAYAVGAVVTGRWAAHGGGAMQVPAVVRDAVRADPGQLLTVADASQVEPRILAAMSGDRALAEAASGPDLYLAVAEQGRRAGTEVAERSRAKVALLGAMYGATTGDSAALIPHLRRLYPHAMGLLERAARDGETGVPVSTWLGRSSPAPDRAWRAATADVSTAEAESRSRTARRSAGRFTRNFVIQGTAAEWALCWMGEIRRRLRQAGPLRTQLVFFVHDEVVLHGPAEEAAAVHRIITESAGAAGRMLFGAAPVDFPLTVAAVESYADAH